MRHRRRLLLMLGLAGLAVLGGCLLWPGTTAHHIDLEHVWQVEVGMSEAEVEALFGVPAGNYHPRRRVLALGTNNPAGPMKVWVGSELGLAIWFDEQGRVCAKRIAAVIMERETFLGRLRRWVGL